MPVAGYDIEKYTRSMMKKMGIIETENNLQLFVTLIKNSVGLNPRGMKRLFNTYRLLYNVLPQENSGNLLKATQEIRDKILRQRILFAAVCMQMSFESVYDYLSAGNIDVDILEKMSAIDDKAVRYFLKRRSEIEIPEDDILEVLFDRNISPDELRFQLQKFPTFIKNFVDAIHAEKDGKISEKEVNFLRDIFKNSAVTSVKSDQNIVSDKIIERKQKNRAIVQKLNSALSKNIGEFKIPQTNPNDRMATEAVGFFIFSHSEKIL